MLLINTVYALQGCTQICSKAMQKTLVNTKYLSNDILSIRRQTFQTQKTKRSSDKISVRIGTKASNTSKLDLPHTPDYKGLTWLIQLT